MAFYCYKYENLPTSTKHVWGYYTLYEFGKGAKTFLSTDTILTGPIYNKHLIDGT